MNSRKVPTYCLTTNHRFGANPSDGILINARKILGGIDPEEPEEFTFEQADNFTLMAGGVDMVQALVGLLHKKGILYTNIAIITPYNKELALLNNICQGIYLPGKEEKTHEGRKFIVGDRVRMTVNYSRSNLCNGDVYTVIELCENSIKVMASDKNIHEFKLESKAEEEAKYNGGEESQDLTPRELSVKLLTHAYAYSIDNAQGSEWEYVILYIPEDKANQYFLNKNRLYVAVTRAKNAIWCIGDMEGMRLGALRSAPSRHETLHMRLNPPVMTETLNASSVPTTKE